MARCGARPYYGYYDTPDGDDVDKKMLVTARYGAIAGMVAGTYDVLMYSHAVGLGAVLKRYMVHTAPLALMGATFALVANGVQKAREKDDALNYFIGGLACGPILAFYLGSAHGLVAGGLALGAAGATKKMAVDECYTFFPPLPRPGMGVANGWRRDYSLVVDPAEESARLCKESVCQQ